jgi:hypothetical protein
MLLHKNNSFWHKSQSVWNILEAQPSSNIHTSTIPFYGIDDLIDIILPLTQFLNWVKNKQDPPNLLVELQDEDLRTIDRHYILWQNFTAVLS